MRVLLSGGGTGGHITPLLAVAHKLKQQDPSIEIIYVGERGSRFVDMTKGQSDFDQTRRIFAGKFRRYNGESWLRRLLDVKTNFLNLRDLFYFAIGTIEAWFLLRRAKPDVIFLKGGFVGVPVGLAARKRIPIVTHDSDALPGLANRLVSRWAVCHATGMPAEYYQYPKDKVKYVGVIVADHYKLVTPELQKEYWQSLGIPGKGQLLFITGGSLGARSVNQALAKFMPHLLEANPDLHVMHVLGKGNEATYGDYQNQRLKTPALVPYDELYKYSGAADLVVTRAGANTMAEFAVQGKACIVVPNPFLAGGHQTKNANFLEKNQAAMIVADDSLQTSLQPAIEELLKDQSKRAELGKNLHKLAPVDAAQKLANILQDLGGHNGGAGE